MSNVEPIINMRYINALIDEAKYSDFDFKMSALLIYGGKIISKGHNRNDTPSKRVLKSLSFYASDYAIHAEVDAIINLIKNNFAFMKRHGNNLSIIIARVTPCGDIKESMPCFNCLRILKWLGVKSVFYIKNGVWVNDKVDNITGYKVGGCRG